jgi:hypothetical protein
MTSSTSPAPGSPTSPPFAVTSPADMLSYIPHALGFMPEESLVVLTTSGRRLGATLRVDLPPDGSDPLVFAQGVLSFLQGDAGADGSLVVVYARQEWARGAPAPRAAMVLKLEAVLGAAGLPVGGGWFVSAGGWRDYFCMDAECCPWPGQPLDAVVDSALNAELIFGGSAFHPSAPEAVFREAPAVVARSGTSATTMHAVEDAQAHYAACCAGHWTDQAQFHATSAVWDAVLQEAGGFQVDVEPDIAGFLLASVESRTVRDFLLASACVGSAAALEGATACCLLEQSEETDGSQEHGSQGIDLTIGASVPPWVPGVVMPGELRAAVGAAEDALPATLRRIASDDHSDPSPRGDAGEQAAQLYADVLAGRHTGRLAWHRVDSMTLVLAGLASVAEGESRAAVLTMCAWFEYARGRGSRATVFLDAAEQAVPGYRLARLLQELLRRGGLPAWARIRSTAWTAEAGRSSRRAA